MEYSKNAERNKFILKISKEEMTEELKKEVKSVALWSPILKAYISRATIDGPSAKRFLNVMQRYNILETVDNDIMSWDEHINKKIENKEKSIEKRKNKAESMKEEYESMHGNLAFHSQPNIYDTVQGRAFSRQREKITERYDKGMKLQIYNNEKKEELEKYKERTSTNLDDYITIKQAAEILKKTYATVQSNYVNELWVSVECKDGKTRKVIKKELFQKYYIDNNYLKIKKQLLNEGISIRNNGIVL